jgi:hypothetical protein
MHKSREEKKRESFKGILRNEKIDPKKAPA